MATGIDFTDITGPLEGLTDFTQAPFGGTSVTPFDAPAGEPFSGAGVAPFAAGPRAEFRDSLGLSVGAPNVTVSPEARGLVRREFDAARGLASENLLQTARTAAGRRGMRLIDTPIGDPLLRSQALLESQLGGQEASTILGLSTNLRDFLQEQARNRESAIQGRFGLEAGRNINRAQLAESGAQFRGTLGQRAGEFGETARLARAQLGELGAQYRGTLGQRAGEFAESANLQRTSLFEDARKQQQVLAFAAQQFQETLKQRAFENRLSLGQLGANIGLGLAGVRSGTPTASTTIQTGGRTNFNNVLQGLSGIALGLGLS